MEKIRVLAHSAPYDILLDEGLVRRAGTHIVRAMGGASPDCVVVTSKRIFKLHGAKLRSGLKSSGLKFSVLEIPEGETRKSLNSIALLMRHFAGLRLDRACVVIAFGGGVIGDIAGFAASIYLRGVSVIQIPTTLLAQVDASIGGKTGVNLPEGKNLVGTFHQPKLVMLDPSLLETLLQREFRAGLYEVIKCGIIRDPGLFNVFEDHGEELLKHGSPYLPQAILHSIRVKADIVALDERESDLRRILNFGHTIGHALEAAGGYKKLLHGESVGWGMIAASYIGEAVGVTPLAVARRIRNAVLSLGAIPRFDFKTSEVMRLISADKKTVAGVPHFVLVKDIGQVVIASDVPASVIKQTLNRLFKPHNGSISVR